MSAILDVRHLGVTVGGQGKQDGPVTIVDDVSFTVSRGEVLGLAGESGSGKTMTALALMGILPPHTQTSGTALFDGRDDLLALRGKALRQIQGRRVAMVFQDPASSLHPMLTVGRQLTEHVRHHLGIGQREARERAVDLLDQVRIPNPRAALGSYPHQFSGGMRQRIQIAIALACDPELLIADEPTTALDVTIQAGILRLLDRLCSERGLAVLLITHDLGILSAIAGRVLVMYSGRVIESSAVGELMTGSRHPYTRALLSSVPHPGAAQASLVPIAGTPPAPAARPPGCAFAPRCDFAEPACAAEVPALALLGDGHASACLVDPFLAGDRR
jgi:oligopeptide transport system ATP-binding protein